MSKFLAADNMSVIHDIMSFIRYMEPRVLLSGLVATGLGALMAAPMAWPVRPGWIGAAALILWATASAVHWERLRRTAGDDPGARERQAWHAFVATALVTGHLAGSLLRRVDLHVGQGNTLALDNWTLVAASLLSWLIVRPRRMIRDERDVQMASLGAHAGHAALITLLLALLLALGFAPGPVTAGLDLFTVANLLMAVLLSSLVVRFAVQLVGYRLAWAGGGRG